MSTPIRALLPVPSLFSLYPTGPGPRPHQAEPCTRVRGILGRAYPSFIERRVRDELSILQGRCGAAVATLGFDSALRCDIHFHAILLDGVDTGLAAMSIPQTDSGDSAAQSSPSRGSPLPACAIYHPEAPAAITGRSGRPDTPNPRAGGRPARHRRTGGPPCAGRLPAWHWEDGCARPRSAQGVP